MAKSRFTERTGCDALWTHDNRLLQASHGLAINVLA